MIQIALGVWLAGFACPQQPPPPPVELPPIWDEGYKLKPPHVTIHESAKCDGKIYQENRYYDFEWIGRSPGGNIKVPYVQHMCEQPCLHAGSHRHPDGCTNCYKVHDHDDGNKVTITETQTREITQQSGISVKFAGGFMTPVELEGEAATTLREQAEKFKGVEVTAKACSAGPCSTWSAFAGIIIACPAGGLRITGKYQTHAEWKCSSHSPPSYPMVQSDNPCGRGELVLVRKTFTIQKIEWPGQLTSLHSNWIGEPSDQCDCATAPAMILERAKRDERRVSTTRAGDLRIEQISSDVSGPLLTHADAFGIARTGVTLRPQTRTVKILVHPPAPSDGEFGDATAFVTLVKDDPTGESAVKTEKTPDGGTELTLNAKDLAELAGIFFTFAGAGEPAPIQYVDLKGGDDLSSENSGTSGVSRMRDADGPGRPNLTTNASGETPLVAIEGIWNDGDVLGLGKRDGDAVKPTATFNPAVTITEYGEDGAFVGKTVSGTFSGSTRDVNVFGFLNEEGTGFRDGSIQNLNDVVDGGLPAGIGGPLTPTITATPATVSKGDKINVKSILKAEDARNYDEANTFPAGFAQENLDVVIFYQGKEVASGVGKAVYDTTATTSDVLMEFTSTVRWKNKPSLAAKLREHWKRVLTSTEAARRTLPPELSSAAEASQADRAEKTGRRFEPK